MVGNIGSNTILCEVFGLLAPRRYSKTRYRGIITRVVYSRTPSDGLLPSPGNTLSYPQLPDSPKASYSEVLEPLLNLQVLVKRLKT